MRVNTLQKVVYVHIEVEILLTLTINHMSKCLDNHEKMIEIVVQLTIK